MKITSYQQLSMSHEHRKVSEMTTGAGGVTFIGVDEFAALSGPVSHHGSLGVVPERAVGVIVVLHL